MKAALTVVRVTVPLARCFGDGSYDQRRWDEEERDEYVKHAANTGATCLVVNYLSERELDGGSFGGAMVVGRDGSVLAEMSLGKSGLIAIELRSCGWGRGTYLVSPCLNASRVSAVSSSQ